MDQFGAMVMIISGIAYLSESIREVAFLKVSTDAASERLQLINRNNGELVWHVRTDGGETIKLLLPVKYAIDPLLLCVLFDDSFANNAAVIDGVQCELIDASSFDIAAA